MIYKRLINFYNVRKNKYDLSDEQFEFYANPEFNKDQREEIVWGFRHGLSIDDVKKYLDPSINSHEMYGVLEIMLNKQISRKLFDLYQTNLDLAKAILNGIGSKSRNRYMSDNEFEQIMKFVNTNKYNNQIGQIAWEICFNKYSDNQINELINDENYLNEIANCNNIVDKIREFFKEIRQKSY